MQKKYISSESFASSGLRIFTETDCFGMECWIEYFVYKQGNRVHKWLLYGYCARFGLVMAGCSVMHC